MKEIKYDYSKFSSTGIGKRSKEETEFKKKIKFDKNVIYFFYKIDGEIKDCLYIGETSSTLYDRCYKHSPKERSQPWFQQANCVYIIQLENFIDHFTRRAMEALLIGTIKPKYNKK